MAADGAEPGAGGRLGQVKRGSDAGIEADVRPIFVVLEANACWQNRQAIAHGDVVVIGIGHRERRRAIGPAHPDIECVERPGRRHGKALFELKGDD